MKKKTIVVGLAGNPNSGKTTIFNMLTGARQKVANWSGVTVEKREGTCIHKGYILKIVDLPGTYSLTSYSIEEIIARDFIIGNYFGISSPDSHRIRARREGRGVKRELSYEDDSKMEKADIIISRPDVIINVVDAGNLERNLYLTTQLIDMRAKVVMALNMSDEAEAKGVMINTQTLVTLLGMNIVKTIASKGTGITELKDAVLSVALEEDKLSRHIHINYGDDIEREIKNIQNLLKSDRAMSLKYSSRWLALQLIEGDSDAEKKAGYFKDSENILKLSEKSRIKMEKEYNESIGGIFIDMRYGFITGAIKEAITKMAPRRRDFTRKIDSILTNQMLAFPILIIFLWLLFEMTFIIGKYPMNLIEKGVTYLSKALYNHMPVGYLRDLIVNGILRGIGGVIIFLPNILILFMGISFMEDTGYMARAAFIMDKIMHKMGLHGKSFISLVMGFGCNVPAIMATRSLENAKDRILTILINPFMSCSARLPVYILFAGTFFAGHAGAVITSIYLVGILLAFLSAKLFQAVFFKGQSTPFVMELPPYRLPTVKTTLLHMWDRGSVYLRKVAGIILLFSIIVWALSSFPKSDETEKRYSDKINNINNVYAIEKEKIIKKHGASNDRLLKLNLDHDSEIEKLQIEKKSLDLRYSLIGRIGDSISPIMKPLGFSWQMSVSLTTGFVAKEIVVSTMNVLYQSSESGTGKNVEPLHEVLKKKEYGITPLIAYTFLLFVLMYIPCLATVSIIGREAGWRWAFFSIGYQTVLAWIICFIFYNAGSLLGY